MMNVLERLHLSLEDVEADPAHYMGERLRAAGENRKDDGN